MPRRWIVAAVSAVALAAGAASADALQVPHGSGGIRMSSVLSGPGPSDPSTAPRLPGGRACGKRFGVPFGALYASEISVRRISCSAAKRTLSRTVVGTFSPPGWKCRTVGEVYEGSTRRCTRHRSAIQFNAGI